MRLPVLLLGAASCLASPAPSYEVKRAASPPVVDGRLDEGAWKSAGLITFEFPWDQQTGAKQKTTARLLWDDERLYIGYECEDADIVAQHQSRDDPTYRDDAVEVFINPLPSQPNYYGIEMNALAVIYDYFMVHKAGLIRQYNLEGVHIAVHTRGTLNVRGDQDQGWSLEVSIPWRNFDLAKAAPPAPGSEWTANLNRWDGVEPNRRLSQWSNSEMTSPNPHNPARFGRLIFVK